MIKTTCPHCNAANEIPSSYVGREVTCPSCKGDYTASASPNLKQPKREQEPVMSSSTESSSFIAKIPLMGWLMILFIVIYVYTNKSTILPAPKDDSGFRRPPAIEVRPSVQTWEYKVERFRNASASDPSDTVVLSSYDDAKKPTAVFISASDLNSKGDDGWELVSTYLEMETAFYNFGKSDYHTGIKENVRPQSVVAIFKRPKR